MNRNAAKLAIKAFIRANEADLLSGLSAQGVNRILAQVTTSISPPSAYYWIGIEVASAKSFSLPNVNFAKPPEWARHEMVIHMSDHAIFQIGDDEPYETMHSNFDLLGDRIVRLVRPQVPGTTWIPSADATPRFQLQYGPGEGDQIVTINSLCMVGEVTAGLAAMLYAQVRFVLFEECVDLDLLG